MDPLPPPVAPSAPAYKDQRTGLIVFGVFLLLAASVFLLSALSTLFLAAVKPANVPPTSAAAAFTPAALGAVLLWLGLGSIRGRRWARALILAGAWIALCAGAIALPVLVLTARSLGSLMQQQGQTLPAGALLAVQVITVATGLIFYVVFPGLLVWFYRRESVRLTCEQRDPSPRWTDGLPLPLLAFIVLQAYGGGTVVFTAFQFGGAFPLCGTLVQGAPSYLAWFALGAAQIASAWGCARRDRRWWLAYFFGLVLVSTSSVVSFATLDFLEFYRVAGLPPQQLALIANSPLLQPGVLVSITVLGAVAMLIFTLVVGRYFPARARG